MSFFSLDNLLILNLGSFVLFFFEFSDHRDAYTSILKNNQLEGFLIIILFKFKDPLYKLGPI